MWWRSGRLLLFPGRTYGYPWASPRHEGLQGMTLFQFESEEPIGPQIMINVRLCQHCNNLLETLKAIEVGCKTRQLQPQQCFQLLLLS